MKLCRPAWAEQEVEDRKEADGEYKARDTRMSFHHCGTESMGYTCSFFWTQIALFIVSRQGHMFDGFWLWRLYPIVDYAKYCKI